jgi:hypothetical protein
MTFRARHAYLWVLLGTTVGAALAACANDYTCADYATCAYDAGVDGSRDASIDSPAEATPDGH